MIGEERALIQEGTNKETKEMESGKRQRKWNGHGLLFFQVFLLYFTLCIS